MKCRKCGSSDIYTSWHDDEDRLPWGACELRVEKEHLHYYCRGCRFSWTGQTREQEERSGGGSNVD